MFGTFLDKYNTFLENLSSTQRTFMYIVVILLITLAVWFTVLYKEKTQSTNARILKLQQFLHTKGGEAVLGIMWALVVLEIVSNVYNYKTTGRLF